MICLKICVILFFWLELQGLKIISTANIGNFSVGGPYENIEEIDT
jgi:hypothetical protein